MFELNDALERLHLPPARTLVLRNAVSELGEAIYWIADERPELFCAYQHTQGPQLTGAMKGAQYIVSCIGHSPDRAVFVGVYEIMGGRLIDAAQFNALPEHQELARNGYGMLADSDTAWAFDLQARPFMETWKGKLVFGWPGGTRSWWRHAGRNRFPIEALVEESIITRRIPPWQELVLTWAQLALLPTSWRTLLSQWRGIYFIHDERRRLGYVGSAAGAENLLGRWLDYAASGHGGNKLLRQSQPADLRFSVLERTSPDMAVREVVSLEQTWKRRLHTHTHYGLNEN
ncbi:GIY-YIG nuclease family protein [Myxococcus qinghaiensis]|uniref:GIY-YIG nuclease family protein n=1 Tax=Myxococcus qinghaiensis TaxID=2906758 RepID=UPI0020A7076C|nr:GIY-YIG nuclease family protein [Myxococcus qinghaiensis]MCP3163143.1 GIY-YIG nuclease family protein [Myxococcus qinghaiensis]